MSGIVSSRWLVPALGAALLVASVIPYRNVPENEFIWDDPIVFQRQIPYFDSLENVLSPPASIPQFGVHYYRPTTVVSYLADEWIAKRYWTLEQREEARRFTYHASVVVYHAIATLLVFLWALMLTRAADWSRARALGAAFASGALFATHPIHVENVAWMAGRADILCAVFVLLALLLYLRARREARAARALGLFALSALSALLAMGSKEMGASVVLAIPLLELLLPLGPSTGEQPEERLSRAERRRRERELKSRSAAGVTTTGGWSVPAVGWLMLAAVTLAYLLQRREVLGVVTTPAARTPISMIEALFGSLGWYARKVVWAPPQSAFVVETPGGLLAALGLLIALCWASAVGWLLLARLRGSAAEEAEQGTVARWRAELVAVGLFLVTLAPSLAIAVFSISETRLAERYLYLPSAGASLLAGLLLARLASRLIRGRALAALTVPAAAALLLAVPAGWASAERSKVWRSDLEFWIDAVKKAEDEGLPHLHLGMAFSRLDYTEKAIEQYEMAFEKYNDAEGRSKAQNNLASAFIRLERFEDAIAALKRALQENPRYPTAHYNWGVAETQLAVQAIDEAERVRRVNNALGQFRRALQLNPRYVKAHLRYGLLLVQIGQTEPGISHLQRVIMLDESSREAAAARSRLAALGR